MKRLLALALLLSLPVFTIGAAGATSGPATPTNLEATCDETSCTLVWGPSQPGPFVNLGEPKRNQVLVGWGSSQDTRSAVTYTLSRDGATVASGLTQPQYLLTGVGPKVKSMRLCVQAFNAAQQASPQTCGTWTR